MIYNFENLNFQILTIDKFKHEKGLFHAKERPFASISIRIKGKGVFKTENKNFISNTGDITFLPENISYDAEYSGGECIAVHLKNCNYYTVENITPKNIERIQPFFEELLKIKDDIEKTNEKKSLVYKILQALYDDTRIDFNTSIIEKCVNFINQNYTDCNLTISNICKIGNISEATLRRLFNQHYGMSPKKYLIKLRLNKGTQLLIKCEKTVNEIAEECGFSDEKYFSRCIKKHFGVSPINLRQQN